MLFLNFSLAFNTIIPDILIAKLIVGYLVVRVKKINSLRQAEEKIKRARNRRDESLQRAEQEVLHYKQSHPTTDSAFILTLSLSELTQQLNEGSLTPEDVFYSYMEKDSVLVQVLKKQGAIPFVKTNLPQGLLSYDCSNPIYGQTVNPHNPQKTSGGSSGGEGALIGGGGSLLGIGTDLGGSIRIPASFCGICGFKPTAGRLSSQGSRPIYRGQKSVLSSPGPMARDVDSLALCMQALLCDHMFSLDPTVPPLPFNMEIYRTTKPLRIGCLENDGYMHPSPSMARGVREVKALLEQAGHTNNAYLSIYLSIYLQSPRVSAIIKALCGVGSVPELWKQHAAVEDYIQETIAHWRSCNIDVLLCPVIGPAYNFFYCSKIPTAISYTIVYNLLNFPAGVVTVSTVTAKDEEELKHYKGCYQDMWDKLFKEAVTGGEGLPVAVQCVALPWQDELCLRLMKEVEQLVKQSKK
ncbi:fatty-acid amide hydrolase 1-like [Neolamprologus brichardi]|uniref:fatty-acid amide hydrolase 1-like n=1 Tax=Neolamprologus brichardi TaxID=32507 RepID=UPI00164399DF|nr:fatty-acid amide hydrolase 1-like [Neolamprologus brichardi]